MSVEARRTAVHKYEKSIKGRATRKKYDTSAKGRDAQKRYHCKLPQLHVAKTAVARAKANGAEHDKMYLASMPCPLTCPILGTPISFELGVGARPPENTASFDQIIPGTGYVPGNVRIISKLANAMLQNASPANRLAMGKWLVATYESV